MAQKVDESLATIRTRREGAGRLFLTPLHSSEYRILITRSFVTLSDQTSIQRSRPATDDVSTLDIANLLKLHAVDEWWGEQDEGVYSLDDGEPE